MGYRSQSLKESDTAERLTLSLHSYFSGWVSFRCRARRTGFVHTQPLLLDFLPL